MKKFILEGWKSFEKAAVLTTAGLVQRQAMRDAFYAGALSLFTTLREDAEDHEAGGRSPGDSLGTIEALDRELEEYGKMLDERAAEFLRLRARGRS